MRYAQVNAKTRTTRLVTDLLFAAWIGLWYFIANAVKEIVDAVAKPIREIGNKTDSMATDMNGFSENLSKTPLVGESLSSGVNPIGAGLSDLSEQAYSQADNVLTIAWIIFAIIFLFPVIWGALKYLPECIRAARETSDVLRYVNNSGDFDLVALRALATMPMRELAKVTGNPVSDWREGNADAIRNLASLELDRVGLKAKN